MTNNKQGFTLIELLVVVLIIGILAAMAMPAYFRSVERARISEAEILLGTVVQAQQRYKLRRGSGYAKNWKALDTAPAGVADGSALIDDSTFCTKGITGSGNSADCGNGFKVVLAGTDRTGGGVKSDDNTAGVIATRTGNDQYGKYTLARYYDDPSNRVYCTAETTGEGNDKTTNANAQALCIDFIDGDEYDDPGCVPGTDAYTDCFK